MSQRVPDRGKDAYGTYFPSELPAIFTDRSFTGRDRSAYHAKSNSHGNGDYPLRTRHKGDAAVESYSSEQSIQGRPPVRSRKRIIDAVDIETNISKRYRGLNSLNTEEGTSSNADYNSPAEQRENGRASHDNHNTDINHRAKDTRVRHYENSQLQRQTASRAQNLTPRRLSSPFWENSSTSGVFNCEHPGEKVQRRMGNGRAPSLLDLTTNPLEYGPHCTSSYKGELEGVMYPDQEPKAGNDAFATESNYSAAAAKSGRTPDVIETSRKILTQISKDSDEKSGSMAPRTPDNPRSPKRDLDAQTCTGRRSSDKNPKLNLCLPKAQYTSPNLSTDEDVDELESTSVVHLLERLRYGQPHTYVDFRRIPYKAANILPRKSISYNNRSDVKIEISQSHPVSSLSGGSHNSPIYIDSPPGSPDNVPVVKISTPMKDRLLSSKAKPTTKLKANSVYDRQKRAAEIIIGKEQDVLDKEIFGELLGDRLEENCQEANFERAEAKQKWDNEEKTRLLREEMQRVVDREMDRLHQEAAERERIQRVQAEEKKKVKREAERKKQMAIDEALKEERRKKAEEQIQASRRKEIVDREKRDQEILKAIAAQADAAKRSELELKREIAKLQAASLKSATVYSNQSKNRLDAPLNELEEEESLFLPEVDESGDQARNSKDELPRGVPNSIPEVFARKTNFRSRYQEDREAFDARRKDEAERKRREKLQAKLAARYERGGESSKLPFTGSLREEPDAIRKDQISHKLKTNQPEFQRGRGGSHPKLHCQSSIINADPNGSASEHRPQKSAIFPIPEAKKYASEVVVVPGGEQDVCQNSQRPRQSRSEQQNEARRKKNGEKVRENYRQRLLREAEEGGYTIDEIEMNKRLEAYMRKREEKYQKKKVCQVSRQDPLVHDQEEDSELGPDSSAEISKSSPAQVQSHDGLGDPEKVDEKTDPEQQARDQNAMHMREAIEALAKSSNQGSRFAKTAAKRTISALQSHSEASDKSDESEEDPDDDPTIESLLAAQKGQNQAGCIENIKNEDLEEKTTSGAKIEGNFEDAAVDSLNSSTFLDSTQLAGLSPDTSAMVDTDANASFVPHQLTVEARQSIKTNAQLVRIYIVNIQQTLDGEEQPPQDLKKFLSLSEANSFAEDKVKEYHSDVEAPHAKDFVDQLFQYQVTRDDMNSTRIWVASEIVPCSSIPSFDPKLLKARFPTRSWLTRFKTVKDIFDQESQTWKTHITTDILSNHHYSDVELANYAAFNHLVHVLKPPRPKLDHLEQYENDFIPELRRVRDDCCKQKAPFVCAIEKSESQAQWLSENEVEVTVVCYEMQGPLN